MSAFYFQTQMIFSDICRTSGVEDSSPWLGDKPPLPSPAHQGLRLSFLGHLYSQDTGEGLWSEGLSGQKRACCWDWLGPDSLGICHLTTSDLVALGGWSLPPSRAL